MVFYQAVLLAGYAYAHVSMRWLGARRAGLHLLLLLLPLVVLPIALPAGWTPPDSTSPVPWLLALLAVAVGLPFFAVSATSPVLQAWFAATGHRAARDPYVLYAASNLGSMLALLAYPVFVERSSAWTPRAISGRGATARFSSWPRHAPSRCGGRELGAA